MPNAYSKLTVAEQLLAGIRTVREMYSEGKEYESSIYHEVTDAEVIEALNRLNEYDSSPMKFVFIRRIGSPLNYDVILWRYVPKTD